jgi:LEA14-like dessication related protein
MFRLLSIGRSVRHLLLIFCLLVLGSCAGLQRQEPIDVIVVGVEPIQGEGFELRMLVKLRIQNPNDVPLDFNGVSVEMNVQGKRFATGVSDVGGSVPRFGETVVAVPVSISAFRVARQFMGVMTDEYRGKLAYEMTGKLAGPAFGGVYFKSTGELTLPGNLFEGK